MIKHTSAIKQEELNDFISSYDMSMDRLVELVHLGIREKESVTPVKGAFRGGNYLGCPGKDIYFALNLMSDVNVPDLVEKFSNIFPKDPPTNHAHISACVRYIYGCFDKNGVLLSKNHAKIIAQNDWQKSCVFMDKVRDIFRSSNNTYGLIIHHEMRGHRVGDEAVNKQEWDLMSEMSHHYEKAQSFGVKIKSYKHTFTPFYWAACYFEKYDPSIAVEYHLRCLRNMDKYCPDTREGYVSKASHSLKYINKYGTSINQKLIVSLVSKSKNKCLRRIMII